MTRAMARAVTRRWRAGLAAARRRAVRATRGTDGQEGQEGQAGQEGNVIIEFVFLALVVMVPLVYLLVAVAQVQRAQVAVANAARDAGRAYATADGAAQASERVAAATRLALANAGLAPADPRFVAAGADCSAEVISSAFTPGAQFTVCVTVPVSLPAVPSVVRGKGITVTGRYTVHRDDYAEADG